jgi:hypothetical protein
MLKTMDNSGWLVGQLASRMLPRGVEGEVGIDVGRKRRRRRWSEPNYESYVDVGAIMASMMLAVLAKGSSLASATASS